MPLCLASMGWRALPLAGLLVLVLQVVAPAQTADQFDERARAAIAAGQTAEAESLWLKATQATPTHFAANFNLGLLYWNRKLPAQALPHLQQAAKVRPTDFNTHFLLGATHSQMQEVDPAIRAWRKALALQPKNLRLLQSLTVEYGKGRYFQEALAAARAALQLDPQQANLYFLAIKASQDMGDWEAGGALAAEVVRRFPNLARANFEHGFYLQKRGQLEAAMQFLAKANELDPTYEEPPFFLADLLVKQGRHEEALPHLAAAIARRNDFIPARVLRGRALMNLERWTEAEKELQTTAALDPRHPQPHLLLSQVYFRQGREEEAKRERELSLRLRRENPTVLEAAQSRPFSEK